MHAIISDTNYKPCLESNLKYFIFILPFSHIYYIMLFHHGKKSLAQWFNSQCYKKKLVVSLGLIWTGIVVIMKGKKKKTLAGDIMG